MTAALWVLRGGPRGGPCGAPRRASAWPWQRKLRQHEEGEEGAAVGAHWSEEMGRTVGSWRRLTCVRGMGRGRVVGDDDGGCVHCTQSRRARAGVGVEGASMWVLGIWRRVQGRN